MEYKFVQQNPHYYTQTINLQRQRQNSYQSARNSPTLIDRVKQEQLDRVQGYGQEGTVELVRRVREKDLVIQELAKEIDKWKSYRLSEEDEARRQTRKHKQRVQELEILLNQKLQEGLSDNQSSYQSLQKTLLTQRQIHKQQIDEQRRMRDMMMDELQIEFKKVLYEVEEKSKRNQKAFQQNQLELVRMGNLSQNITNELKYANQRVSELENELAATKSQLCRVIEQQEANKMRKMNENQERQMQFRYEVKLQDKIIENQKLKLTVDDLQQELKKYIPFKNQLQSLQTSFNTLSRQTYEKNEKNRFLEKMVDTLEYELKTQKTNRQELQIQLKSVNRQLSSVKSTDRIVPELQRQLCNERNKVMKLSEQKQKLYDEKRQLGQQNSWLQNQKQKLMSEKNKEQLNVRTWRQKYESINSQKERIQSAANMREIQLEKSMKELQERVHQKNTQSSSKQKQFQNKIFALQDQLNQKSSSYDRIQAQHNRLSTQLKELQSTNSKLEQQIQQIQKQLGENSQQKNNQQQKIKDLKETLQLKNGVIEKLTASETQKLGQIKILLDRLQYSEIEAEKSAVSYLQGEGLRRSARLGKLEILARLANIPNIDQQRTIEAISDWGTSLLTRNSDLEIQLRDYKGIVKKLKEENDNLVQRYQKYKNIVIDLKQRKDIQKQILSNNYRFNDEILTHCQKIIRGDK